MPPTAGSSRKKVQLDRPKKDQELLLIEMTNMVPGVVYQFYARPNGAMGFYYVSPKSEHVIGLKPELEGYLERFIALIVPEQRESFIKSIEKSAKESSEWKYEGMLQKPSGEKIWFSGNSIPSPREDEIVFNGIVQDITESKRAKEALRESEEIFSQFMSNSPIHLYIKDEKLRLIKVSDSFEELLGKPISELLGKDSFDLLPPDFAKSALSDDLETLKGGLVVRAEESLNGRVYSTIKFPIHRGSGKPDYLGGFSVDITERKHAEEELQKLANVVKYSSELVNLSTLDGTMIFLNEAGSKMLGISPAEVERTNIMQVIPPHFKEMVENELLPTLLNTGHWAGDLQYLNLKTRQLVDVHTTTFTIINRKTGAPLYFANVSLDITERKRAEEAIAAEKERLAVTLRSIGDGVITTDTLGNVVIMNKVAEELCGWKQDEAQGQPITSVFNIINEITRKPHENPVEKVIASAGIIELANHTLLIARDSTERIIADSGAPIKDIEGKIIGVVLVFRDMTEKQKLDEAMHRSQKLESLGVLAGGIAHDFNNLMGGLFGYIDLANEEPDRSKVSSYLSKAVNTIDRARALTGQLLTFAKGGAPIQKIGHLFPFIRETAQFALSGANVSCRFDVPQDLWACNFDKNQIGQVIDNIIINAQQAMPVGGTIELTARNITLSDKEHSFLSKGDYIKISVKDHGIGIQKEHVSKIFDPFFTTKTKGHGLGLTTCYSIVKRHAGCIDVESEIGKGATFHVYLPASVHSVSSSAETSETMHKGSGTFLIMDDEPVMRETIRDMLKSLGYTVICKENGNNAVEFFAAEMKAKREIVGMVFDLTVPGAMGGMAAVEEIRKLDKVVPVFVASGYAEDPAMKNPSEYGFLASICKPFRKSEISKMLNKYMRPIQ
jgi:PAS domain S-box-containing protein